MDKSNSAKCLNYLKEKNAEKILFKIGDFENKLEKSNVKINDIIEKYPYQAVDILRKLISDKENI